MSWGAKPGSFHHSVDTWSSDLVGAEEHARFHAVDEGPECEGDEPADRCEACGQELELLNRVDEETGEIYFECAECGAEYQQDEIPNYLHPERDNGEEESKEDG